LSEKKISQMFKPYKGGYEGDSIQAGISNTRQRLIAAFGPEYDVIIENSEGKGTTSLVKYPKSFDEKGI
jgi:two-component system, LytTR family, sensor kinase